MDKRKIISNYFRSWVTRDFSESLEYFHQEIVYKECYGPMYVGISEVSQWIQHMLKKQTVIAWNIDRIFAVSNSIFIVEWYFCARETVEYDFDGVSIIEFDGDKIVSVSEYEQKHETYRPYEEK